MSRNFKWPFEKVTSSRSWGEMEEINFVVVDRRAEKLKEFKENNRDAHTVMCVECACIFDSKDRQTMETVDYLFQPISMAPASKQKVYFLSLCPECFVTEAEKLNEQEKKALKQLRTRGPAYF